MYMRGIFHDIETSMYGALFGLMPVFGVTENNHLNVCDKREQRQTCLNFAERSKHLNLRSKLNFAIS